jgi:hypothetical protein
MAAWRARLTAAASSRQSWVTRTRPRTRARRPPWRRRSRWASLRSTVGRWARCRAWCWPGPGGVDATRRAPGAHTTTAANGNDGWPAGAAPCRQGVSTTRATWSGVPRLALWPWPCSTTGSARGSAGQRVEPFAQMRRAAVAAEQDDRHFDPCVGVQAGTQLVDRRGVVDLTRGQRPHPAVVGHEHAHQPGDQRGQLREVPKEDRDRPSRPAGGDRRPPLPPQRRRRPPGRSSMAGRRGGPAGSGAGADAPPGSGRPAAPPPRPTTCRRPGRSGR